MRESSQTDDPGLAWLVEGGVGRELTLRTGLLPDSTIDGRQPRHYHVRACAGLMDDYRAGGWQRASFGRWREEEVWRGSLLELRTFLFCQEVSLGKLVDGSGERPHEALGFILCIKQGFVFVYREIIFESACRSRFVRCLRSAS